MEVLLFFVALFILGMIAVGIHDKTTSKNAHEKKTEETTQSEEEVNAEIERVMEAREKLTKQIEDSLEEDTANASRMQESTLGRYSFKVKGLVYREKNSQMGSLFLRKYCTLHLEPEPDNPYDPNAVRIYSDDGNFFLGYVEASKSSCIAAVYPNIKSCFISEYEDGPELPYITATAYFQKEIDGKLVPYKIDGKIVE